MHPFCTKTWILWYCSLLFRQKLSNMYFYDQSYLKQVWNVHYVPLEILKINLWVHYVALNVLVIFILWQTINMHFCCYWMMHRAYCWIQQSIPDKKVTSKTKNWTLVDIMHSLYDPMMIKNLIPITAKNLSG